MPASSIVFDPELDERQLDREVGQIDDRLASVGEDVPVSFDQEELDSLSPPGGGGGGGGGFNAPTANNNPEQLRQRFSNELQRLQEMGFYDEQTNLQALQMTGGNLNAAVEYLLSNPIPAPTQSNQNQNQNNNNNNNNNDNQGNDQN